MRYTKHNTQKKTFNITYTNITSFVDEGNAFIIVLKKKKRTVCFAINLYK